MIKKTADLINEKKIEGVSYINDESDRNGMRIVIILKKDAVANVVLNKLYKYTQLQTSFNVNNIALVNGRPYPIKSGQYYLFTGSLKVRISTKHPGSMGHWAVTVEADRAPVAGNGNSRPKSPCETERKNAGKEPKSRN